MVQDVGASTGRGTTRAEQGHLSAACTAAGIPDAHFHDLRHTGGTLAATTGATPKELMTRLGHSSTRAAMIYQHATRDRDKVIAQALGTLADKARSGS